MWTPQTEALLKIRVVDTDTQLYHDLNPLAVLSSAEHEIKGSIHRLVKIGGLPLLIVHVH